MISFGKSRAFKVNRRLYRNVRFLYPLSGLFFHLSVCLIVTLKYFFRLFREVDKEGNILQKIDTSDEVDAIYNGKTGKVTKLYHDRVCSELCKNDLTIEIIRLYYRELAYIEDDRLCLPCFENVSSLQIDEVNALASIVSGLAPVNEVSLDSYLDNSDFPYRTNRNITLKVGLSHGDFHRGNIKRHKGKLLLIDWDFVSYRYINYDSIYYRYLSHGKALGELGLDTFEGILFAVDRCGVIKRFNELNEEYYRLRKFVQKNIVLL